MGIIDFDSATQVKKHAEDAVTIKVGELFMLLNYFYIGGGEPEKLKARWKLVQRTYKDELGD